MTKLVKLLVIPLIVSFALISCNTTSPNKVKKSDAQKVTNIEYGTIKTSLPVKIEGESDWIGATAGAMIGGLLASQICGEEEILGTKCQDIAVVYGAIGGAALGYVIEAKLGNHDGFQYIIDIDEKNEDIAVVQGDKVSLISGERVVILYGNTIRVTPFGE